MTQEGGSDEDIERMLRKARAAFSKLRKHMEEQSTQIEKCVERSLSPTLVIANIRL